MNQDSQLYPVSYTHLDVYKRQELDSAFLYLELFAPDTEKQEFESRISALFANKWMVDLIDNCLLYTSSFLHFRSAVQM